MLDWLPILVMLVVAVGFALASLGASYILSPKKATPEKLAPYECGIFPEVEPSQRFPVKFYMVAMLYIVFDIEIIFLFAWATRFSDLGWFGIAAISIFSTLLSKKALNVSLPILPNPFIAILFFIFKIYLNTVFRNYIIIYMF